MPRGHDGLVDRELNMSRNPQFLRGLLSSNYRGKSITTVQEIWCQSVVGVALADAPASFSRPQGEYDAIESPVATDFDNGLGTWNRGYRTGAECGFV